MGVFAVLAARAYGACYACYTYRGNDWYDRPAAIVGLLLLVVGAYYTGKHMESVKGRKPRPEDGDEGPGFS